ncbi:hypothetical protein [Methylophaga sp.]|uniref:hypothetical protein n=1 Tax=Methylophaga sp. TaxID=2024840 RepID=UPI00272399E4|nr:hypothetical protein [Methylophaga sp.]MDO8827554.1 hypothetical protein [Methylophaga sp.]
MIKKTLLIIMFFTLAACGGSGGSVSGEYIGQENAWVDKLVFGPDDKVRAIDGDETALGIFTVEGDKVMVAIGGDQNPMTIRKDGCLDGGYVGVYCKK